ncbi:MAG: TolC family protein, partial [Bacteroidota bacterium]
NRKAGRALAGANIRSAELSLAVSENELVFEVRSVWYELAFLLEKQRLLESQDTLLADFVRAAEVRLRVGETGSLERATAISQSGEVRNQLAQVRADIQIAQIRLQTLLAAAEPVGIPAETSLEKRSLQIGGDVSGNPALAFFQQQIALSEANVAVEKARRAPDFSIGYVNQSLVTPEENADPSYSAADRFHVVQAGVAVPIFGKAQKARIEAAQLERQVAEASADYQSRQLEGQFRQALQEYEKQRTALEYFEQSALPAADLLLNNGQKAFRAGEVDYVEYVQAISRANEIRLDWLDALDRFNEAVIAIEFLTGK